MASLGVAIVYEDAATVTVSDTLADPAGPFASLLVTAIGTVKLHTLVGTDVSLAAVVVGQEIHIATQRVWSTGTSATVIGLKAPAIYRVPLNTGVGGGPR